MGIVLTGRRPDQFLAGADVEAIATVTDPGIVRDAVMMVHELFGRLEGMRARTVAAVGGPVPGGAFEISLACDAIVATDDKKTRIGLPETQLGIIPGWGGSHRLPKRVGVPIALDAILTGRLYPAKKAKRLGMVDRLTKKEYLVRVASDLAMGRERLRRRSRGWKSWLVDRNPLARFVIANQATKQIDRKAHGNYPAPYRALDIVLKAPTKTRQEAAKIEAEGTVDLVTGKVCKNLVSIFFASEAAKKAAQFADGSAPPRMRGPLLWAAASWGRGSPASSPSEVCTCASPTFPRGAGRGNDRAPQGRGEEAQAAPLSAPRGQPSHRSARGLPRHPRHRCGRRRRGGRRRGHGGQAQGARSARGRDGRRRGPLYQHLLAQRHRHAGGRLTPSGWSACTSSTL